MTNQSKPFHRNYYLFGSRVLTHILFWLIYYVSFSLIWSEDKQLYASFGLEFVLMPVRISAAYYTMYFLIPQLLLKNRILQFLLYFGLTLVAAGILQRAFIYYFYELFFSPTNVVLWDIWGIFRAMLLVNSTVLFLSAIKMFQYWQIEHDRNVRSNQSLVEIRAEKRNYRINPSDILYLEGLGNYVTYYFHNRKPLISYCSLKEASERLPDQFDRIHKSFVVNKDWIESYTAENIEIDGRIIPIGKSNELEF